MPSGKTSGGYAAKALINKGLEEIGRTEKKTDRVYSASICDGASIY
jgi:hypothetical protein